MNLKKEGLPERRLGNLLSEKKILSIEEAKNLSGLNDNEFQAALGALKKKALLEMKEGKLKFNGTKEEISGKTLEEQFLESLPMEYENACREDYYEIAGNIIYYNLFERGPFKHLLTKFKDVVRSKKQPENQES